MRRKTEAKRQQILEGAGRIFQAQGYQGTTLNDVAREVGCSKVTIYNYFESRDDLLRAVIQEGSRPTMTYLKAQLESADPISARLKTFARVYLSLLMHEYSIAMVRLMISQGSDQSFSGEFSDGASSDIWPSVQDALGRELADPSLANELTQHLRALLHGGSHYRLLIGGIPSPSESALAAEADKAVTFLLNRTPLK